MSANEQADVVVVGLGPGGEYVAGTLADAGLDVVGVEAELVGGECPYWACVPSKMMIRAGNLLAEAGRMSALMRRGGRDSGLGQGRRSHPRRGNRRLGRPGGHAAVSWPRAVGWSGERAASPGRAG